MLTVFCPWGFGSSSVPSADSVACLRKLTLGCPIRRFPGFGQIHAERDTPASLTSCCFLGVSLCLSTRRRLITRPSASQQFSQEFHAWWRRRRCFIVSEIPPVFSAARPPCGGKQELYSVTPLRLSERTPQTHDSVVHSLVSLRIRWI